MFSAANRLLRTESFRVAAIFVGIFLLSSAIMAVSVFYLVGRQFEDQVVQFASSDVAMVRDAYRIEGLPEAIEVVGQRMVAPGASDFFLLQRGSGTRLAGNLAPMPPKLGTVSLPYPGLGYPHSLLGVGAMAGPDLYIFSGSDLYQTRLARQHILHMLIWVLAGSLLLAIIGGVAVSRNFLARIDAITLTCRAIMDGNLTTRIPVRGTRDELDRLSEGINRMLDRIAGLMDNLRQVTNDVAHDLRTPVAHLRHRLERARIEAHTAEDYDRALEAAIAASDDILALFTALLRIAQIEGGARRGGFAPVDLAALLQHLKEVFGPVAEDAQHGLTVTQGASPVIRGDKELLMQLFSNLIENAIVHTPAGTAIEIVLNADGAGVCVTVRDDGPGVPPEEHARLFRRLYRREASRSRPGYGLGLALVSAIAELHDARIRTDTAASQGFSLSVLFPAEI